MKSLKFLRFGPAARIAASIGMVACMSPVSAGLFDDEEARRAILDLRQKIEASSQATTAESTRANDEEAQLRRSLVDLQNQLEALRADVAKLRGQNEQVARDVADMQRKQKDDAQVLNDRLRKLEPVKVNWDGREFLADPLEKRDFESAMVTFRKGDFANAEVQFVDFMNRNPQSGYRPSALFWLGNAQYATKDYKDALANFRSLVSQTPDHMRVPEALLAIANCQLEVKDPKGARKTLEELIASHPGTEAAAAAKERLSRLK
ncbi:MAG: tol-pal system protein YbgF [Burkholderiales bacterium]|nr:tol-pal system protein YbgF [Burkholderiales bacterium]